MAGKFIKGALVEFMPTFLVPLPNVILFQYNPETMTHSWTPSKSVDSKGEDDTNTNPLAVKGVPGESFSFTIAMDAKDTIAEGNPVSQEVAKLSGVYSRLAALEMLQFPTNASDGAGLVGSVSVSVGAGSISASASASTTALKRPVPKLQVPTVLFVWGTGRILPKQVVAIFCEVLTHLLLLDVL